MVLDILKDFAMADRREYVPYCPICSTLFSVSAAMRLFPCNHFLCGTCMGLLTEQRCPFCRQEGPVRTGEALGDTVSFLAEWAQEVVKGTDRDLVVDRLLREILQVRKHLNCKDLPCRVQAEGRPCAQTFKCPYDHSCRLYRKQICPLPRCPNGDRCVYLHSSLPRNSESPAAEANGREGERPKKGAKQPMCCSLS